MCIHYITIIIFVIVIFYLTIHNIYNIIYIFIFILLTSHFLSTILLLLLLPIIIIIIIILTYKLYEFSSLGIFCFRSFSGIVYFFYKQTG